MPTARHCDSHHAPRTSYRDWSPPRCSAPGPDKETRPDFEDTLDHSMNARSWLTSVFPAVWAWVRTSRSWTRQGIQPISSTTPGDVPFDGWPGLFRRRSESADVPCLVPAHRRYPPDPCQIGHWYDRSLEKFVTFGSPWTTPGSNCPNSPCRVGDLWSCWCEPHPLVAGEASSSSCAWGLVCEVLSRIGCTRPPRGPTSEPGEDSCAGNGGVWHYRRSRAVATCPRNSWYSWQWNSDARSPGGSFEISPPESISRHHFLKWNAGCPLPGGHRRRHCRGTHVLCPSADRLAPRERTLTRPGRPRPPPWPSCFPESSPRRIWWRHQCNRAGNAPPDSDLNNHWRLRDQPATDQKDLPRPLAVGGSACGPVCAKWRRLLCPRHDRPPPCLCPGAPWGDY